jgi:hypothetical protein
MAFGPGHVLRTELCSARIPTIRIGILVSMCRFRRFTVSDSIERASSVLSGIMGMTDDVDTTSNCDLARRTSSSLCACLEIFSERRH